MSPPMRFFPASSNVAIAAKSCGELLGNELQVLAYTVKFYETSSDNFALGFSKVSPMESYDQENVEDVVTFLELDPDEPDCLRPPYAKGTVMYVDIFRKDKDINYIYLAFKIDNYRTGTYAFSCKPYSDFFAIQCKPALLLCGFIRFMNLEEYLEKVDLEAGLCIFCKEKKAEIYFDECGHLTYCQECAIKQKDKSCPLCSATGTKKSEIGIRSDFCVNCVNKKCTDIQAINLPCRCMISCYPNHRVDFCSLCDSEIETVKKIFTP